MVNEVNLKWGKISIEIPLILKEMLENYRIPEEPFSNECLFVNTV